MQHSPATVFFDVKRRLGVQFVELRTRINDRLLTPEEAVKVLEIPDGLTIAPHPETPGAAAFTSSTLTGTWMANRMQEAGFHYDAEDAEKYEQRAQAEAEAAAQAEAGTEESKPEEDNIPPELRAAAEAIAKNQGGKVERITPDGMIVVAVPQQNNYQAPDPIDVGPGAQVRFKTDNRPELQPDGSTQVVTRVALSVFNSQFNEWEKIDGEDIANLPDFLTEDSSASLLSAHTVEETRARLNSLGWVEQQNLFLWYQPQELEFGLDLSEKDLDEPFIFIAPLEGHPVYGDDLPYSDDLRDDALYEVPPYFDDNMCENTWELKPGWSRDQIIADMVARGYRHNPELDGMAGG